MISEIRVIYRDGKYNRDRMVPTAIRVVDGGTKGSFGDPLANFYCPDNYATQPHYAPWRLQPRALAALVAAQNAILERGLSIILVDAYRDAEQQARRQKESPNLAVSPAQSKHTRGLAIDARCFDPESSEYFEGGDEETHGDQDAIAEVLAQFGWYRTVPTKEPWHFEFREHSGHG